MNWYHGSPNYFTTFSYDKIRTNGTSEGVGFYFTSNKDIAKRYATNGYLYTVNLHGKKGLSDNKKTLTREELKKYIMELNRHTEFLSNYGDISFEGYDTVLKRAVENEYQYNNTDSEIISSIYNAVGENEIAIKLVHEVLGYDHIQSIPNWGKDQYIYIALINDIIEFKLVEHLPTGSQKTFD